MYVRAYSTAQTRKLHDLLGEDNTAASELGICKY
jgi:hypothetical protein